MAKVLEALERARLERMKRNQDAAPQVGAIAEPASSPIDHPAAPASGPSALMAKGGAASLETISEQVVGIHDVQSPITEQVRQIRANLETVLADYRSRSIVVTSPVSGDGKTLVASNLATVLADNPEHQVLLIDADMRRPDMHRLFGVSPSPGLGDYLSNRCTLEAAIRETGVPNLRIMPAGRGVSKPTVMLSSDRMVTLLGELQRTYQWIVFDSPPLLPVSDAAVLARECVGLILVVRMGQTHRTTITRAQDLLAEMRLPVLGCILNDFAYKSKDNAYYYHYYTHSKGKKKS